MSHFLSRDRVAVGAAVMLPLAVAAILLPFRADWSNTNVALVLVVAVVAIAAIGNRVAGALAAVSAFAWFDFFFTLPYYRFTIRSSADVTTAVLLLLVGLVVSQLAVRARRLQVITITDARYLAQIHETAALTQSARTPDAVAARVREQLIEVLDLQECRFEYGHAPRSSAAAVARWHHHGRSPFAGRRAFGAPGGGDRAARLRQRPVLRPVHAPAEAGVQAVSAGAPGRGDTGRPGRPRIRHQLSRPARRLTMTCQSGITGRVC